MLSFRTTLWFFVAGAALLTGLLGWLAASRGLAPLRAMRDKAAAVTAEQLSQRLPVDAVPLELAELAAGLNEMLARLEEAFRRLSDFSTDLAHELRTPISNLMTQTQVTLSRARDAAEYRDILESNAEEYERLAKMITDMLFLARAENGLEIPHREEIDLAVEVQALFDFYDALAEEKNIAMTRQGEAQTRGDRLMLRRALGNLLANAIRHTPPHGTIRVRISSDENAISIAVGNNGEAIPSQHLERLFDRFYRADPSRQRQTEGAGLGLAIVKSIMVAHGGSISVASANDWTEFTLMLPAKPVVL